MFRPISPSARPVPRPSSAVRPRQQSPHSQSSPTHNRGPHRSTSPQNSPGQHRSQSPGVRPSGGGWRQSVTSPTQRQSPPSTPTAPTRGGGWRHVAAQQHSQNIATTTSNTATKATKPNPESSQEPSVSLPNQKNIEFDLAYAKKDLADARQIMDNLISRKVKLRLVMDKISEELENAKTSYERKDKQEKLDKLTKEVAELDKKLAEADKLLQSASEQVQRLSNKLTTQG